MIKAIAIDDEPPALRVLELFSSKTNFIELQKTFTQPAEAARYLQKFPVDLIFLDIQMPSVSGINFYKKYGQDKMVIFTTAYSQYAVEGFNLSAIDYLLKPFTQERYQQAVDKAHEYYDFTHHSPVGQANLFIRADYSLVKIIPDEILYIEGLDDYLKIHLDKQKTVVARMTLKNLLEMLPTDKFVRVHRSFIVPVKRIETINKKNIVLAGINIPVGTSYAENLKKIK